MLLDFLLNVDLVDGQAGVDGVRVSGLGVEKIGFEVKSISEAVGRVHAHDQRAVTQARQLQPRGSGKTGLPDSSLAAKQKDAHTYILRLG